MLRTLLVAVVALAASHCAAAGPTIKNEKPAYVLTLPDGCQEDLEVAKQTNGKFTHVVYQSDADNPDVRRYVFIEPMGGTIGPERLTADALPPGSNGRIFTLNWQGHTVDAIEILESDGETNLLTYNIQIPLKSQAVQMKFIGVQEEKAKLEAFRTEVLKNLQGETNWKK